MVNKEKAPLNCKSLTPLSGGRGGGGAAPSTPLTVRRRSTDPLAPLKGRRKRHCSSTTFVFEEEEHQSAAAVIKEDNDEERLIITVVGMEEKDRHPRGEGRGAACLVAYSLRRKTSSFSPAYARLLCCAVGVAGDNKEEEEHPSATSNKENK
jgi:hypothetical protein